jgi:hypothetical protein
MKLIHNSGTKMFYPKERSRKNVLCFQLYPTTVEIINFKHIILQNIPKMCIKIVWILLISVIIILNNNYKIFISNYIYLLQINCCVLCCTFTVVYALCNIEAFWWFCFWALFSLAIFAHWMWFSCILGQGDKLYC